jgi:zinc D-Ala-D-Ala carboxypeptidase
MLDWSQVRYFRPEEFDSPDAPGSGKLLMEEGLILRLDSIRQKIGRPMRVVSGYRTQDRNKLVGGVDSSAHVRGYAADIAASNSKDRMLLVDYALKEGISRIGVGAAFVHLDVDPALPPFVLWLY